MRPLSRARTWIALTFAMVLLSLDGCSDPVRPGTDQAARPAAAPRAELRAAAETPGPLVGRASGKCVDVTGGSRGWGTALILYACHGDENQRFAYPAVGATGEIRVFGDLCVDAAGGAGNDFDAIIVWPCHGGANQRWTRTAAGEFRGINGKCLDVLGGATNDGAPLMLYGCHGGDSQRWDDPRGGQPAPEVPPEILVGAGDIADCTSGDDEATAALIDGIPGWVFTTGDNAYPNGTAADFANCYEPSWGRHKSRTSPSAGNHEYHTAGAAAYFDYFGAAAGDRDRGYYSYDLGAWHIVVLNSNISMTRTSPQLQWLQADLAGSARSCTLAYWHHPRFSSGEHGVSSRARPAWDALYAANADVVLGGHDHDYERFAPLTPAGALDPERGIRQFIVGTGGRSLRGFRSTPHEFSEFRYNARHGVLKLELRQGSYSWAFITTDGAVQDSGTGSCH